MFPSLCRCYWIYKDCREICHWFYGIDLYYILNTVIILVKVICCIISIRVNMLKYKFAPLQLRISDNTFKGYWSLTILMSSIKYEWDCSFILAFHFNFGCQKIIPVLSFCFKINCFRVHSRYTLFWNYLNIIFCMQKFGTLLPFLLNLNTTKYALNKNSHVFLSWKKKRLEGREGGEKWASTGFLMPLEFIDNFSVVNILPSSQKYFIMTTELINVILKLYNIQDQSSHQMLPPNWP